MESQALALSFSTYSDIIRSNHNGKDAALMKNYDHITKMESIMVWHEKAIKDLEALLDTMEAHQEDYASLMEYYYSDQRNQDLEDDENGLIPQDLHRGVLSEDEIFDLMGDYRDTAIHMMEAALSMLKK